MPLPIVPFQPNIKSYMRPYRVRVCDAESVLVLDDYRQMYSTRRGKLILTPVDYEMGGPIVDLDNLLLAAKVVQPKYLILPYKRFDSRETLKLVDEGTKELKNTIYHLGAMPQGETLEDWIACYYKVRDKVDVIMLPGLDFELRYGGIIRVMNRLKDLVLPNRTIFLNGVFSYYSLCRALEYFPHIEGVISYAPLACGIEHLRGADLLEDSSPIPELPLDFTGLQLTENDHFNLRRELAFFSELVAGGSRDYPR